MLIEKSPTYVKNVGRALYNKARRMKEKIPDLKILAFLCDPIKRLYSHIKMDYEDEGKRARYWGAGATVESVWETAESYANTGQPVLAGKNTLLRKLWYGRFHSKLSPWIESFGFDRIHLVDGDNLGK